MVSGWATVATSLRGLAAQSKANLTERRSLGVREPQAPVQLGPQDAIFGGKVFVA
jgi:hypothetical protein